MNVKVTVDLPFENRLKHDHAGVWIKVRHLRSRCLLEDRIRLRFGWDKSGFWVFRGDVPANGASFVQDEPIVVLMER
jgi:hypothetical protein